MMTESAATVAPTSRWELGHDRTPHVVTRPRVLLVESDTEIRDLLRWALKRDGCDVIESLTGDDLLDYLTTTAIATDVFPPPDLIVTDIDMPGANVIDVLTQMRGILKRIPIVLLVEKVEAGLDERLAGLGIAAVVGKPFNIDRIRAVVRKTVAV